MADFNKPNNTSEIVSNLTDIRDNVEAVAKQFKGVAALNIPVDSVKYENGIHYRYIGAVWNTELNSVLGGGTGASTALGARQNLGCNDATNLTTGTLPSGRLTGTYNIDVSGNSASSSNASLLEGQNGAFYRNAANINAGILPSARLSGSYGISITGNAATATLAANSSLLSGLSFGYFLNASNMNTGILPAARLGGTYGIDISGTSANSSLLESQNGDFYRNASNLNAGTVPEPRLTSGTTSVKGIVQLTDSVVSISTTTAATPNSVKTAYDLASVNKGLRTVFITSGSGNWIVPAGVTAFKVTVVGGGGGGGGGSTSFGGGGQSGSVCVKWYNGVSAGAAYAYSVGGGGDGGTFGATGNGGTGANATFDTLTAYGGGGGLGNGGYNALSCTPSSKPTTGDFFRYGEMPSGHAGGSGQFGVGGYNPALNAPGIAGTGYGAGGGGATWTSGDSDPGAAGSAGVIIIEY